MSPVECPSCGEKGSIPGHLLGKRIKCQKCHTSFVAGGTPASVPVAASPSVIAPPASTNAAKSTGDSIDVDGLDPATWDSTAAADGVAVAVAPEAHPQEHHGPSPAFTAAPLGPEHAEGPARQYKVLTQKDRWFEGKFDLSRLEDALNHYARQGWVVRAMSTPHVTGFSGGPREEIVILMER